MANERIQEEDLKETPEWRLPCTLPRMESDPPISRSAVVMLLGFLLTVATLLTLYEYRADDFTLGLTVVVLVPLTFWLSFRTWRGHRGALSVFADRLSVQRFRRGQPGARWEVDYESLDRVEFAHRWIRFSADQSRTLRVRIDQLHAEDVFEFLTDRITGANPHCVIVEVEPGTSPS